MKTSTRQTAFTLIELLMVIAIIGILAAIAMPSISNLRAHDSLAATTRQLQDDIARARQFAISQRTTVYMVFCPSNFWSDPGYSTLPQSEKDKAAKLFDKQLVGYNFVTLRSVGEQPGQSSPRYLSRWHVLPEGAIIAPWKFQPRSSWLNITNAAAPGQPFSIFGFSVTNNIPFPSEAAATIGPPYPWLPYIAFNHLGQLESGRDEFIPVVRGRVSHARDATKTPIAATPDISEVRPGESINAFLLVRIDWLTGRSRVEKQEFP